ncbi:MAG: PqqD family peptide modification chaperone [Pseudomonadota bacterium]
MPDHLPEFIRGTTHVETSLGDKVVMMSLEQGKYFALEGTGRRIWDLLCQPQTEDDLVSALAAEYDVAPETCRADLRPFLTHMLKSGLIEERPR